MRWHHRRQERQEKHLLRPSDRDLPSTYHYIMYMVQTSMYYMLHLLQPKFSTITCTNVYRKISVATNSSQNYTHLALPIAHVLLHIGMGSSTVVSWSGHESRQYCNSEIQQLKIKIIFSKTQICKHQSNLKLHVTTVVSADNPPPPTSYTLIPTKNKYSSYTLILTKSKYFHTYVFKIMNLLCFVTSSVFIYWHSNGY